MHHFLRAFAVALCFFFVAGPAFAEEDDFDLGDLGELDDMDPDTRKELDGLLDGARAALDEMNYDEANRLLDEANQLVPMNDEVLSLMEQAGTLADEERRNAELLSDLEREREVNRRKAARAEKEKASRADAINDMLDRRGLSRDRKLAKKSLKSRVAQAEQHVDQLALERDKCIGAAALAGAASGARRCKAYSQKVTDARHELKELERDLAMLQ